MFGRVPVAQRAFVAATYSSAAVQFLVRRLLRVVRFLGATSLWLPCILYQVAEYTFTDLYLPLGGVWKPAFPLSWRLVLSSLFVVPAIACLQLVWLAVSRSVRCRRRTSSPRSSPSLGYMMLPRSESNSLEEGGTADDNDGDVAGTGGSSPRKPPRPQACPSTRFLFWLALLCACLWLALHSPHPGDARYRPLIERANAHPKREGYANNEKIFIAAMFFNNEHVIPYWSDSLVKTIHYLGADNVFVSILESGSGDRSPALLRELDDRLGAMEVSRRILTEDTAITKPDDMSGNNRIDFLSALRNRVLEPLVERGGYDKVLFSNDIYIEPETMVELIKTADGEYDMACGMDFGHFGLYDLWVIRDKQKRLPSSIWPYFFDAEDYDAMKSESPVPVFTCWNGIVIFKADPLLPIHLRSNTTLSSDPLPFELPATHPAADDPSLRGPSPALTPPVGFRASAPSECFSSECFLLPYDLRRVFNLQRILVNPRVIVGYNWRLYVHFKWLMRHPVLRWWVEQVYDGAWMHKDVLVVGDPREIWQWDGGDCHPWW